MAFGMYLAPFLGACIATLLFLSLTLFLYEKIGRGKTFARGRHSSNTSIRISGIIFMVVLFLSLVLNTHLVLTHEWWGMLISLSVLLIFGLWDDFAEISWKMQLLIQCVAASIIFSFGIKIVSLYNPFGDAIFFGQGFLSLFVSFILSTAWIILIINAINWSDGIDGLSGGLVSFGFLTIFILSLRPEVYQPPVAILSLILLGISIGFLIFNFYPAKILAGTGGIWFFGFTLAALSIFSGTKIATSLLVLILPILDAVWVVFDRYRSGASIFQPDKRHFHHRLQFSGWSQREIIGFSYGVTGIVTCIALSVHGINKLLFFVFISFIILEIFLINSRSYDKSR